MRFDKEYFYQGVFFAIGVVFLYISFLKVCSEAVL